MMDLITRDPQFVPGSDTSEGAAVDFVRVKATTDKLVLHTIGRFGTRGCTCDRVEAVLGMRHQTISASIRRLVLANCVVDSGGREQTRSKRTARLYVLTAAGRRLAS